MILRRALPVLALVVLSAGAASAASPHEKAEARGLINEAKKATKERRLADAERAWRRADELDPSPQTKLDLGAALADEGKLVEASQVLHGITDGAAPSPATKKIHEQALRALATIAPRLPWLQIEVGGPSAGQAQAAIDGKDVDASREVPLDPGDHKIAVRAEGFEPAEKTLSLREGTHEHLHLDLVKVDKGPPPEAARRSSGPAIVAFAIGGAGLIVGGAAGISAILQASDAKSHCEGNVCSPEAAEAIDRSKRNGTTATVGFIVGGAGVVTGLIVLLASSGEAKKAAASSQGGARVTPWISLGQAGVSGRF